MSDLTAIKDEKYPIIPVSIIPTANNAQSLVLNLDSFTTGACGGEFVMYCCGAVAVEDDWEPEYAGVVEDSLISIAPQFPPQKCASHTFEKALKVFRNRSVFH